MSDNKCPKCDGSIAYFCYGDDGCGGPILEEWKCTNPNCQHEMIEWKEKSERKMV